MPHAPASPAEWRAYYALRYAVLRQPWGQPPGSEVADDDHAPTTRHALLLAPDGTALAAGRLHASGPGQGQIRFMAVAPAAQGQGLGGEILAYLEASARADGLTSLILHAREKAVPFYERHGYETQGFSYTLFGCIPHYLMQKTLRL